MQFFIPGLEADATILVVNGANPVASIGGIGNGCVGGLAHRVNIRLNNSKLRLNNIERLGD